MAKRRRRTLTRLEQMLRSDGALAVTFVNTGAPERKTLETYDDLLGWGVETGVHTAADAQRVAAEAAEHPAQAASVVRAAKALRERLERIFLAVIDRKPLAKDDFEPFNAELRRSMAKRQLQPIPTGHRWIWGTTEGEDFDQILWPVLYSAGEILTTADRSLLRRCAIERCGLFFVARGAGRPRKYCSARCRNRYSSLSYYAYRRKPAIEKKRERVETSAVHAGYGPSWASEEPEEP